MMRGAAPVVLRPFRSVRVRKVRDRREDVRLGAAQDQLDALWCAGDLEQEGDAVALASDFWRCSGLSIERLADGHD